MIQLWSVYSGLGQVFLPCKSELCEEKGLKAGICTNRYSVPNAAYTYFYFLPWVLHLGSMVRAVRKGRRRWEVKVIECRGANGLDPLSWQVAQSGGSQPRSSESPEGFWGSSIINDCKIMFHILQVPTTVALNWIKMHGDFFMLCFPS